MAKGTGHEHFEHGFTPIPNEVMEGLAAACLNGTQFRIILLVLRETYGFQRNECSLSETYIAARLGMKRQNIHREIKLLLGQNILLTIKRPTFTTSREIALNKNNLIFQKGMQKSKMDTGIESDSSPGIGLDSPPVIESDSSTGIGLDSHRKKPSQETIKETSQETITPPRKEKEVGLREGNEENRVLPPSVPQGGDVQQPDGHCAGGGVFSEGFKGFLKIFPEATPVGSKMIAWAQWQDLSPDKAQEHEIGEQTAALLGDRPELLPSYILGQYVARKKEKR